MSGSGPSLFTHDRPVWSLFSTFPPDAPPAIPPPYDGPSFKTPFPISSKVFNGALNPMVPATIATVYATTVVTLNKYNKRNKNQAWSISKTRAFKAFVILHNVLLAVYSLITCIAMVRALKHAIPHYSEPHSLVGTVDALCKMHGPRGLGDAARYNMSQNAWEVTNPLIHLSKSGLPDSTDLGRVWNEGLAFWGWIFYLSKFYEVLDTFIILAKGKRSSTLQTYHHAGAMLSMWAGMRYMSPPIWMFALVNSGIHAMMYTYYTVSALGYRVPQAVKRTLTSLQILQFIVGTIFAALHLFISYSVPVQVPYEMLVTASAPVPASTLSSVSSFISNIASTMTSPDIATATGAGLAYLKKLVYRAVGEEGLAENVVGAPRVTHAPVVGGLFQDTVLGQPQQQHILNDPLKKIVYRREFHEITCIDNPGQAFAIYLNLIYLAPLTGLFVRFFVKSYIRRTSAGTKHQTKARALSKSASDAAHGVEREIESLGKSIENGSRKYSTPIKARAAELKEKVAALKEKSADRTAARGRAAKANGGPRDDKSLSPANQKAVADFSRRVSQGLADIGEGPEETRRRAKVMAKEIADYAVSEATNSPRSLRSLSPAVPAKEEKAIAEQAKSFEAVLEKPDEQAKKEEE